MNQLIFRPVQDENRTSVGSVGPRGGSVKVLHVIDMKSVFSFSCICCRMQCEVASTASELLCLQVSVCEAWIYEIDDGDKFFCA